MTLGRRLLMSAGGSGGFAPDLGDATFELSDEPSGGWTQVQLDRAVYHAGYTYYGYHDGQSGNNEIRAYNHATRTTSSAFVLRAAVGGVEGSPDSHGAPVFLVRESDQRLMAFYSGHATSQMWMRVTTNPLPDISSWDAEVNLDSQLGKSAYTYPSAFQLTGESGSPIYLFFRDTQSSTSVLCYSTSTDGGATWAAATELVKRSTYEPYWVVDSDGDTRFDLHLIDGYPFGGVESPVKGYHLCYSGGAWRTSDGTAIAGAKPYAFSSLTEIYDAGDGDSAHAWDVNTNGGSPRILQIVNTGSGLRYDWMRWTGSAWSGHTILTDNDSGTESGGAVFDHANPNVVYIARKVSSVFEIWRYQTNDDGDTWSASAVTSGSPIANTAPVRVRNRAPGLRCMWAVYGSAASYLDYSLGTSGTRL